METRNEKKNWRKLPDHASETAVIINPYLKSLPLFCYLIIDMLKPEESKLYEEHARWYWKPTAVVDWLCVIVSTADTNGVKHHSGPSFRGLCWSNIFVVQRIELRHAKLLSNQSQWEGISLSYTNIELYKHLW